MWYHHFNPMIYILSVMLIAYRHCKFLSFNGRIILTGKCLSQGCYNNEEVVFVFHGLFLLGEVPMLRVCGIWHSVFSVPGLYYVNCSVCWLCKVTTILILWHWRYFLQLPPLQQNAWKQLLKLQKDLFTL